MAIPEISLSSGNANAMLVLGLGLGASFPTPEITLACLWYEWTDILNSTNYAQSCLSTAKSKFSFYIYIYKWCMRFYLQVSSMGMYKMINRCKNHEERELSCQFLLFKSFFLWSHCWFFLQQHSSFSSQCLPRSKSKIIIDSVNSLADSSPLEVIQWLSFPFRNPMNFSS